MSNPLKNKKGQAMAEFALSFTLFLGLFLMACDFGFVTYQWTVLQYAANQGARIGSLGYISNTDPEATGLLSTGLTNNMVNDIKNATNASGNQTRVETIKQIVVHMARQFGVEISTGDVTVFDADHVEIPANKDTQPEQLMFVNVSKIVDPLVATDTIQTLLGFSPSNIEFKLAGEAIGRNEPFHT